MNKRLIQRQKSGWHNIIKAIKITSKFSRNTKNLMWRNATKSESIDKRRGETSKRSSKKKKIQR